MTALDGVTENAQNSHEKSHLEKTNLSSLDSKQITYYYFAFAHAWTFLYCAETQVSHKASLAFFFLRVFGTPLEEKMDN